MRRNGRSTCSVIGDDDDHPAVARVLPCGRELPKRGYDRVPHRGDGGHVRVLVAHDPRDLFQAVVLAFVNRDSARFEVANRVRLPLLIGG